MNREQAKALLPTIQAFADGKDVDFNTLESGWKTISDPIFLGDDSDRWRIKPSEPPSIDWSHVGGQFNFLVLSSKGAPPRWGLALLIMRLCSISGLPPHNPIPPPQLPGVILSENTQLRMIGAASG